MKTDSKAFVGPVRDGQRGQTFVLVAIMLPVLLGMAALVIDLGYVYVSYQQLLSATQAAALAGGGAIPNISVPTATTAALNWFISPYIHKIRWQPGSDSFEVEMMSWLVTYIPRTIKFADIRPPDTNRPLVTVKANGNFYYVDAKHCHNKALLARLTPQKATHE